MNPQKRSERRIYPYEMFSKNAELMDKKRDNNFYNRMNKTSEDTYNKLIESAKKKVDTKSSNYEDAYKNLQRENYLI